MTKISLRSLAWSLACALGLTLTSCAGGQSIGISESSSGPAPQPAPIPPQNANQPTSPSNACASGTQLVCDDFETDAVGANPNARLWSVHTQNAQESLTVDSTRAYSGKQSLHIHTSNNGYENAVLVNQTLFPAANNSFFGRFYMWLDQQPQIHTGLISASGTRPGETTTANYSYGGQFGPFLANYYDANNPSNVIDDWQHAGTEVNGAWQNTTPVPTGRWACIEWQFKGDTNEMHLWVDGQAVASMDILGKSSQSNSGIPWTAPPFTSVSLGYTVIQNTEAFDHFDLWLDAVALDAKRIGCLPSKP